MRLYDRPVPVDDGGGRRQTASLTPVEGPRTPYRGYTYTVTPQGREFVWRVYDELGDEGTLLKVGSVVSQGLGEGATAAAQSAKDWIDNYIDELGALQPPVSDDEEKDEVNDTDDTDDTDDPLDPGVSGEFILIGALTFLALAVVFIFDGED